MDEIKQPERLLAMDNILKRRAEIVSAWIASVEKDVPLLLEHLASHGKVVIEPKDINVRLPSARAALSALLMKHGLTDFSLITDGKDKKIWFEVSLLNQHKE